MQLVDQVRVEELPHGGDPAADPHVLTARELPRPLEGLYRRGVHEVEGRLADHQRLPLVVGEHHDWGVERRFFAPPADPAVVGPGPALVAELVPAHDLDPDPVVEVPGQAVLEAAGADAGLMGREAGGGEAPAQQRHGVDVPEGLLEGLVLAGADSVAGDAEVLHTHTLAHGGVLSEAVSMVRLAAPPVTGPGPSILTSLRRRFRPRPGPCRPVGGDSNSTIPPREDR